MKSFREHILLEHKKYFTPDMAKNLGDKMSVNWEEIDPKEFRLGLNTETEHDDDGPLDVVKSEKDLAKIVLAHLKEHPKYYTKLKRIEEEAPTNSIAAGGVVGLKEPIVRKKPKIITRP